MENKKRSSSISSNQSESKSPVSSQNSHSSDELSFEEENNEEEDDEEEESDEEESDDASEQDDEMNQDLNEHPFDKESMEEVDKSQISDNENDEMNDNMEYENDENNENNESESNSYSNSDSYSNSYSNSSSENKLISISFDPPHEKYWHQRHRLFSLFDHGIQLDAESWYSVTPERIARHLARRVVHALGGTPRILDSFCGAGGNAIQFALSGCTVLAIDKDPIKIKLARHNAKIYGVEEWIEFQCDDALQFMKRQAAPLADCVFLSPPWGGVDYLEKEIYLLSRDLQPLPGKELLALACLCAPRQMLYLPRQSSVDEIVALALNERVEVERHLLNGKCKALTVYYGDWVNV